MTLFTELKRRNVFRVGVAYAVAAWVFLQVADLALDAIHAPDWVLQALMLLIALGFVAALIVAWAYEITPEGIKRERDIQRGESVTQQTANKLNHITIALLVVAVAIVAFDRLAPKPTSTEVAPASVATNSAPVSEPEPAPALVKADDKSVAVLPFAFRSTNPEDEFFAEGIHDDLLTQLAKIGSLKVISRTSVMEYKGTTKKIPEIARELGVAAIVEGGVQRSGSKIRINAQLIDARDDQHLWAETYNRELTAENLFDIQAEIAKAIAQALQANLSPSEQAQISRRLTSNLDAWSAYQRALASRRSQTLGETTAGLIEIDHAIELDPGFAAAYSLKAILKMQQYWFTEPLPSLAEEAWAAIQRARDLDPGLPETDIAEAYYHYWGFLDYEAALVALDRALSVMPNSQDAHQARAFVLRRMGDFDGAIREFRIGVGLSPRYVGNWADMGETYARTWRLVEAREVLDRAAELDPDRPISLLGESLLAFQLSNTRLARYHASRASDSFQDTYVTTWLTYLAERDYAGALAMADSWPEHMLISRLYYLTRDMLRGLAHHHAGQDDLAAEPLGKAESQFRDLLASDPESFTAMQSLCLVEAALGKRDEAIEYCSEARERLTHDAFMKGEHLFNLAAGLAMAGDRLTAIEYLDESLGTGAGWNLNVIRLHPAFEPLLDRPEFTEMAARHPEAQP